MLDKSYYHGQQGQCFQQLEKYFEEVKHEFDSQPNKIFLDPEDCGDLLLPGVWCAIVHQRHQI